MNKVKFFTYIFLVLICSLSVLFGHAKTGESLNHPSNYISISEQVYIHTDRDIYVAGENMFFKLYLLNSIHEKTSRVAYVAIRNSSDQPILKARVWLDNNTGYGHIYIPDTLSTGHYQLVSYTNWMRGDNEFHSFTKELLIVNRFDENFSENILTKIDSSQVGESNFETNNNYQNSDLLDFTIEKEVYAPRSKISMKLKLSSLSKADSLANVSISVVDINSCFQHKSNSSVDWRNSYFESYKKRGISIHYKDIETDGLIISGRINTPDTKGLENQIIFLSTPDSVVNLQYEITDPKGDFRFMIGRYYEGKDLFIKPFSSASNSTIKISLEDKFSLSTLYTPNPINISKWQLDQIKKSQSIATVNKAFDVMNTKGVAAQFSYYYCPQLYSKPDQRVFSSDYIALSSLEELIKEIVYGVRIQKKNNYAVSILDSRLNNYFEKGSFIFLDGVLVDNLAEIIDFGTEQIKSIDVINSAWIIDDLSIPGILAVFSKKNDIYRLKSSALGQIVYSVGEYLPRSKFVAPEYGLKVQSNRIPDFRQLLYWNPQATLSEDTSTIVSFYSSDLCTQYLVMVEGFTLSGEPISFRKLIKVGN